LLSSPFGAPPAVHAAYGLHFGTTVPIPGLPLVDSSHVDVRVWLGSAPEWAREALAGPRRVWYESRFPQEGLPTYRIWTTCDGAYFHDVYPDGTDFLLDREATRIRATWPPELSLEDTATYLLGPVAALVLLLRGATLLHASVVAVNDRAVAFVGHAGAGKSTLAAAFARHGFRVMSDDIAPLSVQDGEFRVCPAYPKVNLWPESVAALCGSPDALPRLTPTWGKRYLPLDTTGFESRPLPLAAVYLLHPDREATSPVRIEAVSSTDALLSLVAWSYGAVILDEQMRRREFELLTRLLARVPVRRLRRSTDLANLPAVCDAVLADLA
jgi:hypothetical protein